MKNNVDYGCFITQKELSGKREKVATMQMWQRHVPTLAAHRVEEDLQKGKGRQRKGKFKA